MFSQLTTTMPDSENLAGGGSGCAITTKAQRLVCRLQDDSGDRAMQCGRVGAIEDTRRYGDGHALVSHSRNPEPASWATGRLAGGNQIA
jgi:hypothetical protein